MRAIFNMTNGWNEDLCTYHCYGQHHKNADTYRTMLETKWDAVSTVKWSASSILPKRKELGTWAVTHYIEDKYGSGKRAGATRAEEWDGGYVICGLTKAVKWFAVRDPVGGIRRILVLG